MFPPSSGKMGSRLNAAQTTLTQMNWPMMNALTDPCSGGIVRTVP